jgi:hypothetical protein
MDLELALIFICVRGSDLVRAFDLQKHARGG